MIATDNWVGRVSESELTALVDRLSRPEKVRLTAGAGPWRTEAVPRLRIPSLKMSDGMIGVRGDRFITTTSACFPCGTAMGATWNPDLLEAIGDALAVEAENKGVQVLLAPTLNLHRYPLAGRNFEYFSEDPLLTARLGAAYVRGVQGRGVAAVAKHFVANDAEHERESVNVIVSERALREIYFRPFEAAVHDGGVWAVMTAYNKLNGEFCSQKVWLLRDVLRREWDFGGLVMSDWGGTHNPLAALRAGLDLQMPGPVPAERNEHLVKAASLSESRLNDAVQRLLQLIVLTKGIPPALEPRHELSLSLPPHRHLAKRAAVEGTVLLTNNGVLPLSRSRLRKVAVVGPNAATTPIQGGGSAAVNPHHQEGVLDCLRQAMPEVTVVYEPGCTNDRHLPPLDGSLLQTKTGYPGMEIVYFRDGEPEPLDREWAPRSYLTWIGSPVEGVPLADLVIRGSALLQPKETGTYRFGLISAGTTRVWLNGNLILDSTKANGTSELYFGRGTAEVIAELALKEGLRYDLEVELHPIAEATATAGFALGCEPPERHGLMERAVVAAGEADAAIVVVGTTGEWETEGGDRPDLKLPGRQDELVRRVSAANPNTIVVLTAGSALELDWIDDCAACLMVWFGGQAVGSAVAGILLGIENPSGRLPITFPRSFAQTVPLGYEHGRITYAEELAIGYRHYDQEGLDPRFCFGYGLSYTTFRYGEVTIDHTIWKPGQNVTVQVTLANTGERTGQEVVQLYLSYLNPQLPRPPRELRDFKKVTLGAREQQTIAFTLDERTFACWDPDTRLWRVPAGTVEIAIGSSSRTFHATGKIKLVPSRE